jgi:hypothetical protein
MKKILVIIGVLTILFTMPVISSIRIMEKPTILQNFENKLLTPPSPDDDGTFVGGLGRLYLKNGNWEFDAYAYIKGSYKLGVFTRLAGAITDSAYQQIGYMLAFFGSRIIIGFLQDMESHRAPMIGFLMWNDGEFAGRIMTMFGPATHIIGQYSPNT